MEPAIDAGNGADDPFGYVSHRVAEE